MTVKELSQATGRTEQAIRAYMARFSPEKKDGRIIITQEIEKAILEHYGVTPEEARSAAKEKSAAASPAETEIISLLKDQINYLSEENKRLNDHITQLQTALNQQQQLTMATLPWFRRKQRKALDTTQVS